ncbi:squalene/phytoene synthase family protein [Oceaniglobus roseus]|uniref:squalene/phytoene synthase family protein n=1 Tax=Oceaniglobus roseus TaxID=1737570 RepID=UPI000C7ED3E8|nr:squalene/phytoene synthase family protein [Kandeliimicrobium roseum]
MSVNACAELVRRGDPDRFAAAMAAPPGARTVLFPLYAFNLEVARAPWVTQEPMIAEMRLQWWRDALAEIAEGGLVRRHEVVVPLAQVLDGAGAGLLDALIEARRADIGGPDFADGAALMDYLDATAGSLMWAAALGLGATEGEATVRAVARAAGLARYLAAVPELVAAGRQPLPEGFDVATLCRRALADWPGRPGRVLRPTARPALLEAWQARGVLQRVIAAPERVAAGTLAPSEFARRAGLLRAAVAGL